MRDGTLTMVNLLAPIVTKQRLKKTIIQQKPNFNSIQVACRGKVKYSPSNLTAAAGCNGLCHVIYHHVSTAQNY